MKVRLHTILLATAALAAPTLAHAAGTIEGFYGIAQPPGTSFRGAVDDPHLLNHSEQDAGGDIMFNISALQIGAVADHMWAKDKASLTSLGGLLGFKIPLGILRIDLMGEAGAHRYGNLRDLSSNKDQWFTYLGVRPGIAFDLHPPDKGGLMIGVWGFGRWDVTSKRTNTAVTAGNIGNAGSVKLGGASYGAVARVGFDF